MSRLCACMGPMYGEPYCVCRMNQLGLPLNLALRSHDMKVSRIKLAEIFGWYVPSTNSRRLVSRNKREGRYIGFIGGIHRHSMFHFRSGKPIGEKELFHKHVRETLLRTLCAS